jgi:hypothetical protein
LSFRISLWRYTPSFDRFDEEEAFVVLDDNNFWKAVCGIIFLFLFFSLSWAAGGVSQHARLACDCLYTIHLNTTLLAHAAANTVTRYFAHTHTHTHTHNRRVFCQKTSR